MNPRLLSVLVATLLPGLAGAAPSAPPIAVETPSVPARLLKATGPTRADRAPPAERVPGRTDTLRIQPGVNEIIPVALGHLNRLILPFDRPAVRTVNPASCQLEGHVLYVAPADENPVTLYVTPEDSEDVALSLTLAPRHIPPREIRLTLDAGHYRMLEGARGPERPAAAEPSGVPLRRNAPDYIADLKQTLRALALGQTPPGFTLRDPAPGEAIRCDQGALRIRTGQALEGRDLTLLVGVARNTGTATVAFDERACAESGTDLVAVAAWPNGRLDPGAAAEVYVAVRHPSEAAATARPSLLGGGRP
jgi:conjugal transfer pilus assembly protein TraK